MLYPAFVTFFVFTFADNLLRGLSHNFSIELLLYVLLWLSLAFQATIGYIRIRNVEREKYTIQALISDCIDLLLAIYVCASIGGTYGSQGYNELTSYAHISIPFLLLSVNQFSWFVMIRLFDVPAIFRISILFFGMLAITISEEVHHSIWNLVAVVCVIVLCGILRAINRAPRHFETIATNIWTFVKKKLHK